MRAGFLRHQVTVERKAEAADSYGQHQPYGSPAVQGPVWAEIVSLRGQELVVARQLNARVTHQVRLRGPGLDLRPGDCIVTTAGRRLEVTEVLDWLARGIELQALAIESPSPG